MTAPAPLRDRRLGLLAVLAAAFLARGLYFLEISSLPLFSVPTADTLKYLEQAQQVLDGDLLGQGVYFHSSPIYGYLLAAALSLGLATPVDLSMVAWLQLLVGVGTAGLCWALGRRLGGDRAGLVAGLLYALAPAAVFYDGELLGDFLLPPVVAAVALWGGGDLRGRRLVGLGALIGLGAVARPILLLLLAPLALVAYTPRPAWVGRVGALAFGAMLLVAPVTARNAVVGGDAVLVSSNGGVNLFLGNRDGATGAFQAPAYWDSGLEAHSTREAEARVGHALRPSEVSRFWAREALGWIAAHPTRWAGLVGRRLRLFLGHYEIPNHMDLGFFAARSRTLRWLPARWWLVLALGAAGVALGARRTREHALPLLMLAAYAGGIVALFFVTGRYRFPVFPLLAAFAGVGVAAWPAAGRARRAVAFGVSVVVIAIAAIPPPAEVRVTSGYSYEHLAAAHQRRGELAEAEAALLAGLADAGSPQAASYLQNNLAVIRMRRGDLPGAVDASFAAVALAPDNPGTLLNHVLVLNAAGRVEEALPPVRAALATAPADPVLLAAQGRALAATGDLDGAVAAFDAALAGTPSADTWFQLALCHEERGDRESALRAWNEGLVLAPDHAAAQARRAALVRETAPVP